MVEPITRLKIEFNNAAGDHIVRHYAVDGQTLRKAQIWQAAQKIPPSAEQLASWLGENGVNLDRADGPAVIESYENATHTRIEAWYRNGHLERTDGPAFIATYDGNDIGRYEAWYRAGEFERADGPAVIMTFDDGRRIEQWWSNGKFIKDETLGNLLNISGVTLYPP